MTTRVLGRALASLILSFGASALALAQDQSGLASIELSNLQISTSPVGAGPNGGYTRDADNRQFSLELTDTAGHVWSDGGTALFNDVLTYTHSIPSHDYGQALSGWFWSSSSPMLNDSYMHQAPGVNDWASSYSQQSVQTIFHLAPQTRLTLSADLDLTANLSTNAPWQSATYDFYSVFGVVGADDAQSIHRSLAITTGQDSALNESFSFSIENTGSGTMDIVWQRDASTFIGVLAVPEPAPVSMALAGGFVLFWVARRRAQGQR